MTCIVAKVVDGKVHMAGDKLGSNGYNGFVSKRPKVFFNGEFLIGYTSSFRMGQLLEFTWKPPGRLEGTDIDSYIYTTVVESLKGTLCKDGFGDTDKGGSFLFGYRGNLYGMQDDYAIFEYDQRAAVGCGEDEAMAALFVLNHVESELTTEEELAWAISAAAMSKVGVSSEYDYLCEP